MMKGWIPKTEALLGFLYSDLMVEPSLLPQSSGQKRKREWSSDSGEELEEDLPGFLDSDPMVEPGLQSGFSGQKRKRGCLSDSEEELEDLDPEPKHPWDMETLCGLMMKLKR